MSTKNSSTQIELYSKIKSCLHRQTMIPNVNIFSKFGRRKINILRKNSIIQSINTVNLYKE